jgi:hypothetical protein
MLRKIFGPEREEETEVEKKVHNEELRSFILNDLRFSRR